MFPDFRGEKLGHRRLVIGQRFRVVQEEGRLLGHLFQCFGPGLEKGHNGLKVVQGWRKVRVLTDHFVQQVCQPRHVAGLDEVAVGPVELVHVENRRGFAKSVQREFFQELGHGEEFVVAMGPTQAHQIAEHGLGQIAEILVHHDRGRAVALAHLFLVGSQDHGHVSELGQGAAQGLVDEDLLGRVVLVVVAANDVGHAHERVVHDYGHLVDGRTVCAADDEVVHFLHVPGDGALDDVVKNDFSRQRGFEADHPARSRAKAQLAAFAVVLGLEACRAGRLAHRLHFLGRAGAVVGLARLQELVHMAVVQVAALALEEGAFVEIKTQPVHGVDDGVGHLLRGAGLVRVLDAQDELAAVLTGIEIIEKGGAGAADMEVPRGAWGETGHDLCHLIFQSSASCAG